MQALLRDTSRSFYLTLQVLPRSVRPQIGLAYLLARATDTIADTELVPVDERLAALEALRDRILGVRTDPISLTRLAMSQRGRSAIAEKRLLDQIETAVAQLDRLRPEDLAAVRAVLNTITGGQELDLRRFEVPSPPAQLEGTPAAVPPVILPPLLPTASRGGPKAIRALTSAAELDDYTYRVAGCVGEFWTQLTRRHCFPRVPLDEALLLSEGIAFGQGLQLVNILRDLPEDLRSGRCYLPMDDLAAHGLTPAQLLSEPRKARGLINAWIAQARAWLAHGAQYVQGIRGRRLRFSVSLPRLIGERTLDLLEQTSPLESVRRLRVSRMIVYRCALRALAESLEP